ncbi:hypothetical protein [Mongoliitalea daihaiensis]|uniref:hypothetical protein n=1 Tax=Mongoliitalea daihaiensis TaxID=2782006 RepID=UPI001F337F17|nr:hypothetical protein [Mongoliitalea daihaiensis]UJP66767.1 hypothetical protein IPZ59_09350 [Mongoliitalea daihaiensis]
METNKLIELSNNEAEAINGGSIFREIGRYIGDKLGYLMGDDPEPFDMGSVWTTTNLIA